MTGKQVNKIGTAYEIGEIEVEEIKRGRPKKKPTQ